MKLCKKLFSMANVGVILNALAVITVVQSVNATCFWLAHQPEVPEAANRFKLMK